MLVMLVLLACTFFMFQKLFPYVLLATLIYGAYSFITTDWWHFAAVIIGGIAVFYLIKDIKEGKY